MTDEAVTGVDEGLSPRLRGNHGRVPGSALALGSIPAPAGEPFRRLLLFLLFKVYPRACGGTVYYDDDVDNQEGLSPRLRGNHCGGQGGVCPRRSIPAPAGEPILLIGEPVVGRVYPRACGGTVVRSSLVHIGQGLSLRLRGNQAAALAA